jgi:hypothetical protein
MQNDTVLRLVEVPGIIGIKDATANIESGSDLIRRAPRNFASYSGEDSGALALILLGGHGVISVTANVAPRLMHEMCAAALVGGGLASPLRHAAWGLDVDVAATHAFLKDGGIPFQELGTDGIVDAVVERLLDGQVVGWMQGRFELGPRALGQRSILADLSATLIRLLHRSTRFTPPPR